MHVRITGADPARKSEDRFADKEDKQRIQQCSKSQQKWEADQHIKERTLMSLEESNKQNYSNP